MSAGVLCRRSLGLLLDWLVGLGCVSSGMVLCSSKHCRGRMVREYRVVEGTDLLTVIAKSSSVI